MAQQIFDVSTLSLHRSRANSRAVNEYREEFKGEYQTGLFFGLAGGKRGAAELPEFTLHASRDDTEASCHKLQESTRPSSCPIQDFYPPSSATTGPYLLSAPCLYSLPLATAFRQRSWFHRRSSRFVHAFDIHPASLTSSGLDR